MSRIPFDPASIRLLATILVETGLSEIEIEEKDSRIRVKRALSEASPAPQTVAVAAPTAVAPQGLPAAAAEADEAAHPGAVLSPMVGIVYLSPEPGSAPYVTPGATVAAGQTLLLIEAMKTFNQIKAPRAGTVARVLVASGTPVEYGEALVIVE